MHHDLGIAQSASKSVGDDLTDARDLERPEGQKIHVTTEGGLDFDPSFAGIPARALGWFVDTLIVNLFMAPGLAIILTASSGLLVAVGVAVAIVGFVCACALEARSIARSGRWFGNRLANTRTVRAHNGAELDIGAASIRVVFRHLISPIFMFGYLPALFDSQRRTFHDRFASSVVITRPPEVWTPDDGPTA